MKIKTTEKYEAVILELKGNVMGGDDTKLFNEHLRKLIDDDKKNIVIDLSGVKFMNSSGLGMLIGGLTTLKKADGVLKLAPGCAGRAKPSDATDTPSLRA